MSKNIVLFVDGTNNWGERDEPQKEETNVRKLHQLCLEPQRLYLRGVGSWIVDIRGIAGFGTKKRLRKSYEFLVENYRPGDHIFLFGFSRGALAVRLFAGFLGHVGTLFGGPLYRHYLPHIYQIYESSVLLNNIGSFHQYMAHFGETKPLPIHFLGVWDTVEEYWATEKIPELECLPDHISFARHAVALHERRGEMEPTLWTKWDAARSNVEQVWFPGAHADVGGGYTEAKLAEAPLVWMRNEAEVCGLHLGALQPSVNSRVLHQQRTRGFLIGRLLKYFKGERPRLALSEFEKLPPQCKESFSLHQTAYDQLLKPLISSAVYRDFGTCESGRCRRGVADD